MAVCWLASLFRPRDASNLGMVLVQKHLQNIDGLFPPANIIHEFDWSLSSTFKLSQISHSMVHNIIYPLQSSVVHVETDSSRETGTWVQMVHLNRISLSMPPRRRGCLDWKTTPTSTILLLQKEWSIPSDAKLEDNCNHQFSVLYTASCENAARIAIALQFSWKKCWAIDWQHRKFPSRSCNP